MKLRRAMGGERDAIIVSVASKGYRMAVPVFVKASAYHQTPIIALKPGDAIPGHTEWLVTKGLGATSSGVWLTQGKKTREKRVFKFAIADSRLQALRREVEIARLLQRSFGEHATFLVRILSWNLKEPPFFTESEYGGVNLLEFAQTEDFQAMPVDARLALVAQVADAVEAAHSVGILHNDLKPENILVERADEAWRVKVTDFGVASFADPEYLDRLALTNHDAFEKTHSSGSRPPLGTPAYWAPELQRGGVPTVKCDVYAIGVLLYQIVCGDLQQTPSPGWQAKIRDPLVRDDIAAAANVDPKLRMGTAREIALRIHSLNERRQDRSAQEADAVARARQLQQLEKARLRRPWMATAAAFAVGGVGHSSGIFRTHSPAAEPHSGTVRETLCNEPLCHARHHCPGGPELRLASRPCVSQPDTCRCVVCRLAANACPLPAHARRGSAAGRNDGRCVSQPLAI